MIRRAVSMLVGSAVLFAVSGCGLMDYLAGSGGSGPTTRIVLEAAPADGASPSPEAMREAVDVLRERLKMDERTVADVVVDGDTVTLDVAGEVGEESLPLLAEPAELAFRPVLALDGEGSGGASSDVPDVAADVVAEFEAFDCTGEDRRGDGAGDPSLPLITCDEAGTSKYLLGPVDMDGAAVVEASSSYPPESATWVVILELDEAGTATFAEITERLQGEPSPRNQFAITVDGVVLSAPIIPPGTVISAGVAEISGSFTRESAEALAGQLGAGPLPFPFEVESVSTE